MGEYKNKNGKTRVGNFLKSIKGVAPDVLNLVGNITGVDMLKNLGEAIKNDPIMSRDDKETALELLQMDMKEMEEVTKRWESDNSQDSWLPRNVRPLCLVFLTLLLAILVFIDSTDFFIFDVKVEYIDLLKALLVTVYVAYFGSRGYEKGKKIGK